MAVHVSVFLPRQESRRVHTSPSVPPGSVPWSGPPANDGLYQIGVFDDATQRLPVPPAAPRLGGRWAVAVAVLALVGAGVSATYARQAVDRAEAARAAAVRIDRAASATDTGMAPPVPDPSGAQSIAGVDDPAEPAGPEASGSPTPTGSTGTAMVYDREALTFRIGCSAVLYVDLDEPRANVADSDSDLRYASRCGASAPTLSLGPGADSAGEATESTRTAADCERQIRTGPLGPRAGVAAHEGMLLCVLTSLTEARRRGDTQKMVLVQVVALDDDGTAKLRATSWNVRR